MKKTIAILLALLMMLVVFASCGKEDNEETQLDPNAVLTDSDVPLDVGAYFGQ